MQIWTNQSDEVCFAPRWLAHFISISCIPKREFARFYLPFFNNKIIFSVYEIATDINFMNGKINAQKTCIIPYIRCIERRGLCSLNVKYAQPLCMSLIGQLIVHGSLVLNLLMKFISLLNNVSSLELKLYRGSFLQVFDSPNNACIQLLHFCKCFCRYILTYLYTLLLNLL